MGIIEIKKSDSKPFLRATLEDKSGVIDVTGATIRVKAHNPDTGASAMDGLCTIIDAPNGIVEYALQGTDVDNVGHYLLRFVITFADTSVLSVPNEGWDVLRITNET